MTSSLVATGWLASVPVTTIFVTIKGITGSDANSPSSSWGYHTYHCATSVITDSWLIIWFSDLISRGRKAPFFSAEIATSWPLDLSVDGAKVMIPQVSADSFLSLAYLAIAGKVDSGRLQSYCWPNVRFQ